jgi:hypothetical protein
MVLKIDGQEERFSESEVYNALSELYNREGFQDYYKEQL